MSPKRNADNYDYDLPEVGVRCRAEKTHAWGDPINTVRDVQDDGAYFRSDYVCQRDDCGATRIRRLDRWGRLLPSKEFTKVDLPPGYRQRGGVSEESLGRARLARAGFKVPRERPPELDAADKKPAPAKAPAKKTAAKKTATVRKLPTKRTATARKTARQRKAS